MPRDGADDKKSPSAVDSEGFTPVGKGGKPLKPDGGGKDITAAAGAAGGGAGLAGSPQASAAKAEREREAHKARLAVI